ncbi:MAG: phospholipase, partial [Muribaculaceae bacterium]
ISLRRNKNNPNDEIKEPKDDECCGQHIICEKDSLLTGVSNETIYYDDEELDAYRGIDPHTYSDAQIEQFQEIFFTLRPDDVAGWYRSIQLRQIQLPQIVKDELLLLISEKRKG